MKQSEKSVIKPYWGHTAGIVYINKVYMQIGRIIVTSIIRKLPIYRDILKT